MVQPHCSDFRMIAAFLCRSFQVFTVSSFSTPENGFTTCENGYFPLQQSWKAYLCCQKTVNYSSDPDLLLTVGKCIVHLLGDEAMNPYQG